MTDAEKRLTATLLDLAAETFANHGCNDFDLARVISDPDARDELVKGIYADQFGPDETPSPASTPDWRLADWELMEAMARQLRAEVQSSAAS